MRETTCDYIAEAYNLGDLYNCSSGEAPFGYARLALRMLSRPGWIWTMMRETPTIRPFTEVPQSIYDAVTTRVEKTTRVKNATRASRRLLLHDTSINLTELNTAKWSLLSRNPVTSVLRMGAMTSQYYTERRYDVPPPMCANDSNWLTCAAFRLPPARNGSNATALPPWATAIDVVMLIPTMGGGGLASLDALLSDMPYSQVPAANANADLYVSSLLMSCGNRRRNLTT